MSSHIEGAFDGLLGKHPEISTIMKPNKKQLWCSFRGNMFCFHLHSKDEATFRVFRYNCTNYEWNYTTTTNFEEFERKVFPWMRSLDEIIYPKPKSFSPRFKQLPPEYR